MSFFANLASTKFWMKSEGEAVMKTSRQKGQVTEWLEVIGRIQKADYLPVISQLYTTHHKDTSALPF